MVIIIFKKIKLIPLFRRYILKCSNICNWFQNNPRVGIWGVGIQRKHTGHKSIIVGAE